MQFSFTITLINSIVNNTFDKIRKNIKSRPKKLRTYTLPEKKID